MDKDCPINAGSVHLNGMCIPLWLVATGTTWRLIKEFEWHDDK